MTLPDLLQWIALPGGGGALIWIVHHLHRDAVRAHQQRADDWRSAYEKEAERADELQRQLTHILGAVRATTTG